MTTFSNRLKELRKNNHLSQKLLAEKVGIGERTVQAYELELRTPTSNVLIALSNYFGVSTDYLLGLSNNPRRLE